jgi:ABC-type glycerol-3-phosphate transport system permease component
MFLSAAATVVMVIPMLVAYFLAQRVFIQGMVVSGVKG